MVTASRVLAAGGRHLRADEARADHDDVPWARGERRAEREAVVEGAQREHAGHRLGAGQRAGARPGGDDEAVVVELLAVVERQRAAAQVERRGTSTEAPLDREHLVDGGRQHDAVGLPLTGEDLLRQRRPVVGGVGLVADHDDAARVALVAERLGRLHAGDGRAGDDDGLQGSVLRYRQRLLGAAPHGFLDLVAHALGRGLVEDVEEVVVAHLEHLGGDPHADGVALAEVEVTHDAHGLVPLGLASAGPVPTVTGPGVPSA